MNGRVAITGATGFIGRALNARLSENGTPIRALLRRADPLFPAGYIVGEVGPNTDWSDSLRGVECIIHLAGRAHVLKDHSADPLQHYRNVNRDGCLRLAQCASEVGVKRIVFVSSVGVMGPDTNSRAPFGIHDSPMPVWDYAVSKLEAEQGLASHAKETGMELVIVRPPMVYGPHVPANFLRLLKWVRAGVPLPFGAVNNKRSIVGIDNLTDFLCYCVERPEASGRTFFVSDDRDLSTAGLIGLIASAMGRSPRLPRVPVSLLRGLGKVFGKSQDVERLVGSLQIDISHARDVLGWSPPVNQDVEIQRTVQWFLTSHSHGVSRTPK